MKPAVAGLLCPCSGLAGHESVHSGYTRAAYFGFVIPFAVLEVALKLNTDVQCRTHWKEDNPEPHRRSVASDGAYQWLQWNASRDRKIITLTESIDALATLFIEFALPKDT
jgi:hypothetical protein